MACQTGFQEIGSRVRIDKSVFSSAWMFFCWVAIDKLLNLFQPQFLKLPHHCYKASFLSMPWGPVCPLSALMGMGHPCLWLGILLPDECADVLI